MDMSSNVKNPFLFDDPNPLASSEASDGTINPFFNGGAIFSSSETYSGVNPFADNGNAVPSMNVFGDQPICNPFADVLPTSNAFASTETTSQIPNIFDSTFEANVQPPGFECDFPKQTKPPPPRPPSPSSFTAEPEKPPPPRPPPPSKETKDLLQTVIGTIEATTDTLQDKLKATASPCPSPGGGLHTSRSPTPDIHITSPEKEPDAFCTIFGQTIELSDQEIDEPVAFPSNSEEKSAAETEVSENSATDGKKEDIDLFGETALQSKPKTKEDILSLFNTPRASQQLDLLSDDVMSQPEMSNEEKQDSPITSDKEEPNVESHDPTVMPNSNQISSETKVKYDDHTNEEKSETSSLADSDLKEKIKSPPSLSGVISPENVPATEINNVEGLSLENKTERTNQPYSMQESKEVQPPKTDEVTVTPKTKVKPPPPKRRTPPTQTTPPTQITPPRQITPPAQIYDTNATFSKQPAPPTGFNIFGDVAQDLQPEYAIPVSSGADSTGATLFETTTPAPNVGMSLFGGGQEACLDIFAESASNTMINPFGPSPPTPPTGPAPPGSTSNVKETMEEDFDAFSARFENAAAGATALESSSLDPFGASGNRAASPWGGDDTGGGSSFGFGDSGAFDPFLSMSEPPPVPQSTPQKVSRVGSKESDDQTMNVVIRPEHAGSMGYSGNAVVPPLAPPRPTMPTSFTDTSARLNPFDRSDDFTQAVPTIAAFPGGGLKRSESQETPPTPLFEEDQSMPLEPFPRIIHDGRTWEMHLRQPNKKKITGQRFWKKITVKLTQTGAIQLFNNADDKEPFQELPLQPCYSVSDIGAQQFDQFGKIFTVKLQYIFYKERPGVRPGQISKAERITNKISKFAQYAIAGDYEGVKEFASDVRKLGMPVEHAPQISQLLKLGCSSYEELKVFACLIEEFLFKLNVQRERALTYKFEEVQLTAVDEFYVEQDLRGVVTHMVARVRVFFLAFLSGMPEVDIGINDLRKQGREVVGRHDIIPVVTEEWIRLEDIEFHCTVNKDVFEKTRHIKLQPPDACYIELMRFRVRPPKNRELPLQVKTKIVIDGKRVEIFSEILVPGFSGRKLGQVPCEDVAIRFPLPESWIYMFRVEKHFRYGSVKSAHRRTGKVKGIERLKGAVENAEAALMEVTSGQAKYEHQHRAIVWRISRLPKEGQGAYTMHQFTCRMNLTAYDQIPETLDRYCFLEFTMPATTVSHCVMRSVSATTDDPPEKYVRYLARHEYKIEMEFGEASGPGEYITATKKDIVTEPKADPYPQPVPEESSSDESS